jgi:hypothetical protein
VLIVHFVEGQRTELDGAAGQHVYVDQGRALEGCEAQPQVSGEKGNRTRRSVPPLSQAIRLLRPLDAATLPEWESDYFCKGTLWFTRE